MSVKLMDRVFSSSLPPTRRFVLLVFADHANDDGICWPSHGSVARKTGLHVDTVREHVTALVEAGFLSKVERVRRADNTFGPWIYRVSVETVDEVGKTASGAMDPSGVQDRTQWGVGPGSSGVEHPTQNPHRTVRNPHRDHQPKSRASGERRDYDRPTPDAEQVAADWGVDLTDPEGQIPDRHAERIARLAAKANQ